MIYDVIIIGAGPAGLRCAEVLSESDLKVLLIEAKDTLGDKPCAGGLMRTCIKYLEPSEELIEKKFREIVLHVGHNKKRLSAKEDIVWIIDRKKLAEWQLERINKDKVDILTGSKVTKIEKDRVMIDKDKFFKYKFLVGADGSGSVVRRFLDLKTEKIGIGLQYLVPDMKYKDLEIFYDSKLFKAWYAWIFPHKEHTVIGCGCDPKVLSSKDLLKNLHKWVEENDIDISKGRYEAFPVNFDYQGHKFNNIFLAGDAAGTASMLSGEGIYQALLSGEEVAKMIMDKDYVSDKMDGMLRRNRSHHRLVALLLKSGVFRGLVLKMNFLFMHNKWFENKILKLIT